VYYIHKVIRSVTAQFVLSVRLDECNTKQARKKIKNAAWKYLADLAIQTIR
jgi:hypothetical protein